jgi:hypothetical protein
MGSTSERGEDSENRTRKNKKPENTRICTWFSKCEMMALNQSRGERQCATVYKVPSNMKLAALGRIGSLRTWMKRPRTGTRPRYEVKMLRTTKTR